MDFINLNKKLNTLLETNETNFLQKMITWIFEHSKEAYHKEFWIKNFNLTNEDLVKYEISDDLEDWEE